MARLPSDRSAEIAVSAQAGVEAAVGTMLSYIDIWTSSPIRSSRPACSPWSARW